MALNITIGTNYPGAAGTAGTILRSDGTNFVNTTATYPTTTTLNQILYSSAANAVAGITVANNSILVTNASGVPSLTTALPACTVASQGLTVDAVTRKDYVDNTATAMAIVFGS